MSNRLLWILVILWFIWLGILFYMYFYVYYMWNITVKTNLKNYKITVYNKKLIQTNNYNCIKKICILSNISPFDYSLSITKSWYIDKNININVSRNQQIDLNIILNKKVFLNEVQIDREYKLKNKEKINLLQNRYNSYYFIVLDKIWTFSFKTNWLFLKLYQNKKYLWIFDKVNKDNIFLDKIFWTNDYIFIKIWSQKYIYSLLLNKKYNIWLNIDINYVKLWINKNEFLLITDKWVFRYNKFTSKIEYIDFFRDFIYHKLWYIGIIDKNDKRRLNNLWLNNKTKNLIIYYNQDLKEKRILYETNLNIIKIYKKGINIFFISSDKKEYRLYNN